MITLTFAVICYFIFFVITNYLNTSSYFNIKKITFVGLEDRAIADRIAKIYLGENIFRSHLVEIMNDIKLRYPQFYDLKIARNFPDCLTIYVVQRKPLAQLYLRNKEYFLIDKDGTIISEAQENKFDNFIIIDGVRGLSALHFGQRVLSNESKAALELVSVVLARQDQLSKLITNFALDNVSVDISKYPTISMKIGGLEIRFSDNFFYSDKINMLIKLLPNLKDKIDQIRYIDMRFDEPAISF